jgi:hypothetical protein
MARDVAETIVDLATTLWKGAELCVSLKCWCQAETGFVGSRSDLLAQGQRWAEPNWLRLAKDPCTGCTVVKRGPVAYHLGTQKELDMFCSEMTEDLLSHINHEYMEHDWFFEVVHAGTGEHVYIKPLGSSGTRPRLIKALSGIIGLYGSVKVYSGA